VGFSRSVVLSAVSVFGLLGASVGVAVPAVAADELKPLGGVVYVDQPSPFAPSGFWGVGHQASVEVPPELRGKSLQVTYTQGEPGAQGSSQYGGSTGRPNSDGVLTVGSVTSAYTSGAAADAAVGQYTVPTEVRVTDPATGRTYTGTVREWETLQRPVFRNVKRRGPKSRPVFRGRVTTPSGKPMAGIPVYAMQLQGMSASTAGQQVLTDKRGRFRLRTDAGIPRGTVLQLSNGGTTDMNARRILGQAYSKEFKVR